jgi:hypothetical protein
MSRFPRTLGRLAAAAAAVFAVVASAPAGDVPVEPQPPKGFTALFNGKDFTGWHGWAIHAKGGSPLDVAKMTPEEREKAFAAWTEDMKKNWSIDSGELVNKGKGAYLTTDKDYGDVEFLIEYKISPTVDSGVYMKTMPQVQVWDPAQPDPGDKLGRAMGSGGLWNNPKGTPGRDPLVRADKPAGEWNKLRVVMVGDRCTIHLNDQLVVSHSRLYNYWDKKAPCPAKAPILLQTHPPELEIRWRNIFVREIPADEANDILRAADPSGFVSVFNGKDFEGWAGPVSEYEVKDGAIVCRPKKGGTIFTKDEYSDFVARVEFKLPPGGNNGLAIRYPGQGDTAYVGMCEVQVLDDTDPKYAKLDPRQYCGSVYGIVPAYRGHLRPVGEWNFEEVTVKGSTIKVELNGALIVDADVSKVNQYMANSPHPGKDRTSGHFGFAGHNDPVAFRNISIKKLEK